MAAKTDLRAESDTRRLVVTRDFDAPRELVFELWTTAEHLSHWFCPDGFTVTCCDVDFRRGGVFNVCMRSPDGEDFWWRGTYREIAAPERIVFASGLLDADDNPRWDVLTTATFAEVDGRTRITVEATVEALFEPTAVEVLSGMEEGWIQGLNHLAAYAADI